MGKLRFREAEWPAQGYAAVKGWDWDSDPETDVQLSCSGCSAGGGGEGVPSYSMVQAVSLIMN